MCSPAQSALRRGLAASHRSRRARPRLFRALRGQAPLRQPVGPRGGAARGVAPQPAGAPSPLQPAATSTATRRNLRCNPPQPPLQPAATPVVTLVVTPLLRALFTPSASRPTPLAPPRPASIPPPEPSAAAAGPTPHHSDQRAPALRRPAQRHAPRPAFAPPPPGTLLSSPWTTLRTLCTLCTRHTFRTRRARRARCTRHTLRARCRCSPCVAQRCSSSCTLGRSTRPSCGARSS